jgi:hypothetical protein
LMIDRNTETETDSEKKKSKEEEEKEKSVTERAERSVEPTHQRPDNERDMKRCASLRREAAAEESHVEAGE